MRWPKRPPGSGPGSRTHPVPPHRPGPCPGGPAPTRGSSSPPYNLGLAAPPAGAGPSPRTVLPEAGGGKTRPRRALAPGTPRTPKTPLLSEATAGL